MALVTKRHRQVKEDGFECALVFGADAHVGAFEEREGVYIGSDSVRAGKSDRMALRGGLDVSACLLERVCELERSLTRVGVDCDRVGAEGRPEPGQVMRGEVPDEDRCRADTLDQPLDVVE